MSRHSSQPLLLLLLAAAIVMTAVGIGAPPAAGATTRPLAAFSIAAPVGQHASGLVARAVVPRGVACPTLVTRHSDGGMTETRMRIRRAPALTAPAFSSLIACSAPMPANAQFATIGGVAVPAALPAAAQRIAIFGDSGCRIKGSTVQNCADPSTWPLARISAAIAADRPDLIVFTGDFFYREGTCPTSRTADCGSSPPPVPGMPFKDTDYRWYADVFAPMAEALAAAPIVAARGNHEACDRGGNGYFVFIDPRPDTAARCAPTRGDDGRLAVPKDDLTPTYAVDVPVDAGRSLRFVIVDAAYGYDCEPSGITAQQRARYRHGHRLARGHEAWLITHRPIAAWQPNDDCAPTGGWISVDQMSASRGLLGRYGLVLSSHIHLVQAMQIPGLPGQLVLGNGGTLLEPVTTINVPDTGPSAPGVSYGAPSAWWGQVRFGYALATPRAGSGAWSMSLRDPSGRPFARCAVNDATISCQGR